jgi:hypothetical protein
LEPAAKPDNAAMLAANHDRKSRDRPIQTQKSAQKTPPPRTEAAFFDHDT